MLPRINYKSRILLISRCLSRKSKIPKPFSSKINLGFFFRLCWRNRRAINMQLISFKKEKHGTRSPGVDYWQLLDMIWHITKVEGHKMPCQCCCPGQLYDYFVRGPLALEFWRRVSQVEFLGLGGLWFPDEELCFFLKWNIEVGIGGHQPHTHTHTWHMSCMITNQKWFVRWLQQKDWYSTNLTRRRAPVRFEGTPSVLWCGALCTSQHSWKRGQETAQGCASKGWGFCNSFRWLKYLKFWPCLMPWCQVLLRDWGQDLFGLENYDATWTCWESIWNHLQMNPL